MLLKVFVVFDVLCCLRCLFCCFTLSVWCQPPKTKQHNVKPHILGPGTPKNQKTHCKTNNVGIRDSQKPKMTM